jgi:glycosyltransferase involved in cell wall biosynthesis
MKPHETSGRQTADDGQRNVAVMSASLIVEVLLATYNGERFLREQIDSILSQDYENLRVLARDDGSSDGTIEILNEYGQRFPDRFRIMPPDTPSGSAKENFLHLMQASTAEYVCFSDQDDVWLPNKVSKTMQAMVSLESHWGTATPLLVFTDLRVVDDRLKILHESFWKQAENKPSSIGSLATVLTHNPVTGCTALINRRLLKMALHMPEEAAMHDSWIALLASAFGASEIVREKTVLYRQHDRNVVGLDTRAKSPRELMVRFLQREPRTLQWRNNERSAEALLRIHEQELSAKNRALLKAYLCCGRHESRIVRIGTMFRYRFFRNGFLRNMATIVDLWRGKMTHEDLKRF